MRTVIRPLIPRMEYGLRLFIKRIPYSFFLICTSLLCLQNISAQSVSCYSRINLSVNGGIPTKLSLAALTPMSDLTDIVAIANDRTVLEFSCTDIGREVMITIRDTMTMQQCMVVVNVENKGRLVLTCRDTAVSCIDEILTPGEIVDVVSCHSLSDLTFFPFQDIARIPYLPGSDTTEYIIRRWVASDPNGGLDSCESRIYLRSFDLDEIQFPEDILISCEENPLDTSVTGGINFTQGQLANCNVGVTSRILDTIFCLSKTKYIREWIATSWPAGVTVKDTQYIRVNDTISLVAPSNFTMIPRNCQTGIVLDTFILNRMCLSNISARNFNIYQNDVEIYIENDQVYNIGDTAYLDPGNYSIIYRGVPNACSVNIEPDTAEVTIPLTGDAPILDCSGVVDLSIALDDGASIWIKLDSVFKSLSINSCLPAKIVGRKVNITCGMDTDEFTESLELCPDELLSGQDPGTIMIEIAALASNDNLSNVCIVKIDVQEKVPPIIIPQVDPTITLDGDDMLHTLLQGDVILSLTDNSGCISSVTMTGSGVGITTGSGLPFLSDGTFFTFDCSHSGMYDVAIFATDCDNNTDTAFTKLTVSSQGCMPPIVSGKVNFAADQQPMGEIPVSFNDVNNTIVTQTNSFGEFTFDPLVSAQNASISIKKEDSWRTGLSAIDLKLIQDYILGKRDFTPWQFASADINDSGSVTALDIIMIKKIILGLNNNLSKTHMPWLFSESIEESGYAEFFEMNLDNQNSENIQIRATKRGDVSGDVMSMLQARSSKELHILESIVTDYITHYTIDFSQEEDLAALQFSLEINKGQIGNIVSDNEVTWQEGNHIDVLFYQNGVEEDKSRQTVEFDVYHSEERRPIINLSNILEGIWYTQDHEKHDVILNLTTSPSNSTLFPTEIIASPNPTEDRTKISLLENPSIDGFISVNVYDLQGKLIFAKSWENANTQHIFPVELPILPHFGLYIAQIRINDMSDQLYIMKK